MQLHNSQLIGYLRLGNWDNRRPESPVNLFFCPFQEQCNEKPKIQSLFGRYTECNDRVNSRSKTAEVCAEELIDYLHELDHCVAHSLFSKLK